MIVKNINARKENYVVQGIPRSLLCEEKDHICLGIGPVHICFLLDEAKDFARAINRALKKAERKVEHR